MSTARLNFTVTFTVEDDWSNVPEIDDFPRKRKESIAVMAQRQIMKDITNMTAQITSVMISPPMWWEESTDDRA